MQALAEVEEMKQSLLRRSLTGEVQVMELEEAYKQVSASLAEGPPECIAAIKIDNLDLF